MLIFADWVYTKIHYFLYTLIFNLVYTKNILVYTKF
jgi:hypothetical protein